MDKKKFEKVMEGFDCHLQKNCECDFCPYNDPYSSCAMNLMYEAYDLLKELTTSSTPHLLTFEEVVTAPIGTVVWLEAYFDCRTGLEPFLVDIDTTQKPVICNGKDTYYNTWGDELAEQIIDSFAEEYKDRKIRFWSARPTEEQRKAVKWE